MTLSENGLLVEQTGDSEYTDPNEPRYCICNQVSYGEMVACDNVSVSSRFIQYSQYFVLCAQFSSTQHL